MFLNLPFARLGRVTDIGRVDEGLIKKRGFGGSGYWEFFGREGTGRVLGENVCLPSSLFLICHSFLEICWEVRWN